MVVTLNKKATFGTTLTYEQANHDKNIQEMSGGTCRRSLLNIQVIFLYGFEAVQGQIVVGLTEHSDLPRLRPLTLTSQTRQQTGPEHQRSLVTVITRQFSPDLVVRRSLVSSYVSF